MIFIIIIIIKQKKILIRCFFNPKLLLKSILNTVDDKWSDCLFLFSYFAGYIVSLNSKSDGYAPSLLPD